MLGALQFARCALNVYLCVCVCVTGGVTVTKGLVRVRGLFWKQRGAAEGFELDSWPD